jgi:glycosyltransferase involved in cell wall biosynthesis
MLKVAILHPWFLMQGGGEKVVDAWLRLFPEAEIHTLFAKRSQMSPEVQGAKIHVSWLNRIPQSAKFHFHLAPFFSTAIESFDLRGYDLVISACAPVMMGGASVPQNAAHICYCHTPPRAWWDLYADQRARLGSLGRTVFTLTASHMRLWEFIAAQRVDTLLSNSKFIARRVLKYFRRDSQVIYPPVDTSQGFLASGCDDYYLTVGRLGREKKIELLIMACNELRRPLVIVGTGKEEQQLKKLAGSTITFAGRIEQAELSRLYSRCRAFLFAAEEDFGIAPVEAQSFGRPVIAFGHGGSLETVRVGNLEGRPDTGIHFEKQSVESVKDGIGAFEKKESLFSPSEIQAHARQFDSSVFALKFQAVVDETLKIRG